MSGELLFDAMSPSNFQNLIKIMVDSSKPRKNATLDSNATIATYGMDIGKASFQQCDDDFGVYALDTAGTTYNPNPVTKGNFLNFYLAGYVTNNVSIKKGHLQVLLNDTPMYQQEYASLECFAGGSCDRDMTWFVPTFAPMGKYDVIITASGKVDGTAEGKVMCVHAVMYL